MAVACLGRRLTVSEEKLHPVEQIVVVLSWALRKGRRFTSTLTHVDVPLEEAHFPIALWDSG